MSGERGRRRAAVLLIITSVLWVHEWWPALFLVTFVAWLLIHTRLEGDLGANLLRRWQRVWPPATIVLVPLIIAGTVAYWVSDVPITRKIMPILLNLTALSTLIFSGWWREIRSPFTRRASGLARSP